MRGRGIGVSIDARTHFRKVVKVICRTRHQLLACLGDGLTRVFGLGLCDFWHMLGDQITQVLGNDALSGLAQQLGLNTGDLAGQLSQMLPGVIDQLTPNGQAPQGGLGSSGDLMGRLGGLLAI